MLRTQHHRQIGRLGDPNPMDEAPGPRFGPNPGCFFFAYPSNPGFMYTQTQVKALDFKHRLRVCNAYPYSASLDVIRSKEKLTDSSMPYKAYGCCAHFADLCTYCAHVYFRMPMFAKVCIAVRRSRLCVGSYMRALTYPRFGCM